MWARCTKLFLKLLSGYYQGTWHVATGQRDESPMGLFKRRPTKDGGNSVKVPTIDFPPHMRPPIPLLLALPTS